ncbi:hypothetical protein R0131_06920 [Clostridium sp. AL.422]|uniref:hypothetical protein n=1 Tax=Clostridium TaxID=1485 RepID=UPI00293DF6DF|nr:MULTISPECIES: hypothetical protein [unclassified Clostridium]MDV4150564.1 hypothetical protein [Clostridium sp. AL.422]
MSKILMNLIKSIIFGILIYLGFFYTLGTIFSAAFGAVMTTGISIIVTMLFCTYTIIDTIKEYSGK